MKIRKTTEDRLRPGCGCAYFTDNTVEWEKFKLGETVDIPSEYADEAIEYYSGQIEIVDGSSKKKTVVKKELPTEILPKTNSEPSVEDTKKEEILEEEVE